MRKILYLDIVNDIKGKIEKGEMKPGDILPSEHDLSEYYDVSRTTLRKSLALLVNENYIYTIPGKGNFVCEPTSNHYQFYFDEVDSLKGQIDEVKLINVGVVSPGRKLMRELKVGSFDKVIRVQKAFYMGKDAVQYSNIYLPYQKGNPIVEDVINFANFHGIMAKGKMQFQLKKRLHIEVIMPSYEVRKQLKTRKDENIYLVSQCIVSVEDDMPISYNEFYIRPDYFSIDAETVI